MELSCPKCKSENTQKVSLAYANGVSTRGASALSLAMRPPQEQPYMLLVSLAGLCVLIGGMMLSQGQASEAGALFFLLISPVCGYFAAHRIVYNRKRLPALRNEWQRRYLCLRCSDVFIPAGT
jgi:hypothetical protein